MNAPTLRGSMPVWLLEKKDGKLIAHMAVGDPRMTGHDPVGSTICGVTGTFWALMSYFRSGIDGIRTRVFELGDLFPVVECKSCRSGQADS